MSEERRKLRDGVLKRFKHGFLHNKWKDCYAVLYNDSTFEWYDEKGDSTAIHSILLKDVVPYICVGLLTDRMPVKRPQLPRNCSVHHLVAIGTEPIPEEKSVFWFLFDTDNELASWFNDITSTLPKPGKTSPVPSAPPAEPVTLPYSPCKTNPGDGGSYGAPNNTTIIIDNNRPNSGILMGSLIAYDFGGAYGGHGYGIYSTHRYNDGHVFQHNDTHISNNYYGGPSHQSSHVTTHDTVHDTTVHSNGTVDNNIDYGEGAAAVQGGANDGYDESTGGGLDDFGGGFDSGVSDSGAAVASQGGANDGYDESSGGAMDDFGGGFDSGVSDSGAGDGGGDM